MTGPDMYRRMMRAKIHQATVTQCDLHYVGSITIDEDLLRAVDLRPNEAVWIYNIDNGNRFETYVIRGEAGSGVIGINGAAARLTEKGQRIIIVSYAQLHESEIDAHEGRVVVADEHNRPAQVIAWPSTLEEAEVQV